MGLRNPELSNCARTAHRSTNCGEYQLPQTHIIQNVIVANQTENSDIQITLPVPDTNIHNSSKEVMRTSIPKIKYNFRNHNNTNYHSKYAGHIDGTNNKNKKIVRREKPGKEENVQIKENVANLQYHHHTHRSKNRNPFKYRNDLQHIQYQAPTYERMKKLSPIQKYLKYRNSTYV